MTFYGVGYKMVHSMVNSINPEKDLSENFVNRGGVGCEGGWRFKLANIPVGIILELVVYAQVYKKIKSR